MSEIFIEKCECESEKCQYIERYMLSCGCINHYKNNYHCLYICSMMCQKCHPQNTICGTFGLKFIEDGKMCSCDDKKNV